MRKRCFVIIKIYYFLLLAFVLFVAVDFLAEVELEAQDFLQQDFLAVDFEQEQFANCSIAIDQNFSSCPLGQPAFCHK
jgi:hypothetical protein